MAITILYTLAIMTAAICVVAAWRMGIRDGMRLAEKKEPEPMLPKLPRVAEKPPDSEKQLQERLDAIDRYDGWK